MEERDDSELFKRMYDDNKELIDNKLTEYINKILEQSQINHGATYSITFMLKEVLSGYVFRRDKYNRMIYNYNELLMINGVFKKIIEEHYKLKAVNKFGFNNKMCIEIVKDLIMLFFMILP